MKFLLILIAFFISLSSSAEELEIFKKYHKSVVRIVDATGKTGTGFITHGKSNQRVVITSAHVCYGMQLPVLYTFDKQILVTNIIKIYDQDDLCAMIPPEDTRYPSLAIADNIKRLGLIYVIGYPLYDDSSVHRGRVIGSGFPHSSVKSMIEPKFCKGSWQIYKNAMCYSRAPLLHTSVVTGFGASGGPGINETGQVVGVVNSIEMVNAWTNFTTLFNLKKFLEQL